MKSKIFFCLFLLPCFCFGQITYHFPHVNASWGQFSAMWTNGINGGTQFYVASNDTILNAVSYIKVNRMTVWNSDTTIQNFHSYLREDSTGKVFVLYGTEKLLYDMNASVSDTVSVFLPELN